jgi:hypothetical protein
MAKLKVVKKENEVQSVLERLSETQSDLFRGHTWNPDEKADDESLDLDERLANFLMEARTKLSLVRVTLNHDDAFFLTDPELDAIRSAVNEAYDYLTAGQKLYLKNK